MSNLSVVPLETIIRALEKAQIPTYFSYREAARVGALCQAVFDQCPDHHAENLDPTWLDYADTESLGD